MARIESGYLEAVGDAHRKAYGQFFTHPQVAEFMVRWVLESGEPAVHDPAFGLGAFFDVAPQNIRPHFTGSEVDAEILEYWRTYATDNGAVVTEEDYLTSWGRRSGNIVCNPPYMRFQKFTNRSMVFDMFEYELGVRLSGYTNTASAFLLKSLSELHPRGRLAYIMPLEFLNTGYGKIVKKRLIADSHLYAVISLDCEKDIFPDAITSVGIILYDTSMQFSTVKFYTAESVNSLQSIFDAAPISELPYADLDPAAKWLPYFETKPIMPVEAATVPLERYGRFTRGIATGANEFFILRPSQVEALGLSTSEVLPSITRSAQVRSPYFTDDDYGNLCECDEAALLFRVNGEPSDAASSYIAQGELKGYNRRFLTRSRTPWYKTEHRSPAPLLLGVFSRGRYKIVRNESRALNLTCFHGFQPNLLGLHYIDHLFLYLNSVVGREIVRLSSRRYGDGLSKFEPNDLNTALVPTPEIFDRIPVEDVASALEYVKEAGSVPSFIESSFDSLIQHAP